MMNDKPKEFWLTELPEYDQWSANDHEQFDDDVHVIEKSAYDDLSIKLQRTVSAARGALLEMSAFMGIPDHKREKQINYYMENVEYCAKHNLQNIDESQRNRDLLIKVDKLVEALEDIIDGEPIDSATSFPYAEKLITEYRVNNE